MTLSIVAILVMGIALLLTPLGVPGIWIMIAVLAVAAWQGQVTWVVLGVCVVVAVLAEMLEYVIVSRLNVRYGGSRLAFWGAILGGMAGVMVGMPVPLIGPLIAGFLGSFAGAAVATLYETRQLDRTMRVGWGVLLGRIWAAVAKVGAGVVILVLGAADLLFGGPY